jgi:DNA-binding transcriptional LysR family regulator
MELRHLQYFITVAEELHFSRAAEKLHIAQPPLSQQIRQLEAELGLKLFERTKRKVELTVAGKAFLLEARRVFQQIEKAVEVAQQAARGEIGRLIIGFNSSATYSVLPKILRRFRRANPQIELILNELTTSQQLEHLNCQKIDLGLLYLPLPESDRLRYLRVHQEPLIVAISATNPLAVQAQISLNQLSQESFILPPSHLGEALYKKIIRLLEQNNFAPQKIQEAIQLQTAISLVAGGIGVAIVPASLQNLQRAGVVYKSLQETTPNIEIGAVWCKNALSSVLVKFIATVQEFALSSD